MSRVQNPATDDCMDIADQDAIKSKKKKRFVLSTVLAAVILVVGFAGYKFYKTIDLAARDCNTYHAYHESFE